jgi:hypothetical protein
MDSRWTLIGILVCSHTYGCSANVGAVSEDIGTMDANLMPGNWQGPFTNGDLGPSPIMRRQYDGPVVAACEAFNGGMWHPGKMWMGQCRYEYADRVAYANSYFVLQAPSGYTLIPNPDYNPPNAVGSSGLTLPVCWGSTIPTSDTVAEGWGKVWLGKCRYEYGDTVYEVAHGWTDWFGFVAIP